MKKILLIFTMVRLLTGLLVALWINGVVAQGTAPYDDSKNTVTAPYAGAVPITNMARSGWQVNVKDFGATGNGTTNENVAMAAGLSIVKSLMSPDGVLTATLKIPQGEYLVTLPLNFTGIASSSFDVDAYGAIIHGAIPQISGNDNPILDMLGSKWFSLRGITVEGDCTTPPDNGLQIGRVNTESLDGGGSGLRFRDVKAVGCFTLAGAYNFSGEVDEFDNLWSLNNYAGGSGSCFALIQDGINHFTVTSRYVTQNAPANTAQSFNKNLFLTGQFSTTGGCTPIWTAGSSAHTFINGYLSNTASNGEGVYLYTSSGAPTVEPWFDFHSENASLQDIFFVTGPIGTPTFTGFHYREAASQVTRSYFKLDTSTVSTASMAGADLRVAASDSSAVMFNEPTDWTVSGQAFATNGTQWNLTNSQFTGIINLNGTISFNLPSGNFGSFTAGTGTFNNEIYMRGDSGLGIQWNGSNCPGNSFGFLIGTACPASIDSNGNFAGNTYKAGSSLGLSCSGTPSSSFASVGGIVTHC